MTPGRTEAGEPVVHTMELVDTHKSAAAVTRPAEGDKPTEGKVIAEGSPTLIAAGIFVAALIGAVLAFRTPSGPSYTPAVGIGAFALFYIVAQAAERAVEFLMPALGKMPPLDKSSKAAHRDVMTAAANSRTATAQDAQDAADAQASVDQAVANRRIIGFAATAALGMLLCSYLEADFLTSVGVTEFGGGTLSQTVQVGVTGLVVGGGSVGLHDLIGNITKSSKAKDDPVETGGTK